MNVENTLLLSAYTLVTYLAVRGAAWLLYRWPKSVALLFSLLSGCAMFAVRYANEDRYGAFLFVTCGLVAGTLKQWFVIRKTKSKRSWTSAES